MTAIATLQRFASDGLVYRAFDHAVIAAMGMVVALLIPAVWHPAKTTATTQMAVIQPLPLPTEADPWHGMSDAERVRGDAEAYPN